MRIHENPILITLLSAVLFGISTPLCKLFVGEVAPQTLAALLYLGSALGMSILALSRSTMHTRVPTLGRKSWLCLMAALVFGGILAPVALMFGLSTTSAASASLLLNSEGVFTALIAWCILKENFDRRILSGMILIALASLLLCWQPGPNIQFSTGALFVVVACLLWALDNNFMRKVSTIDAVHVASMKGWVGGLTNLSIAMLIGKSLPDSNTTLAILAIGFLCYGASFGLFILGLRSLGAARATAYFSTAPFIGMAVSLLMFGTNVAPWFWLAIPMALVGVWLHIKEKHEHNHVHPEMVHDHLHVHDEHHQHQHDGSEPVGEPHSHIHRHEPLQHTHHHYPDIHHRHEH